MLSELTGPLSILTVAIPLSSVTTDTLAVTGELTLNLALGTLHTLLYRLLSSLMFGDTWVILSERSRVYKTPFNKVVDNVFQVHKIFQRNLSGTHAFIRRTKDIKYNFPSNIV